MKMHSYQLISLLLIALAVTGCMRSHCDLLQTRMENAPVDMEHIQPDSCWFDEPLTKERVLAIALARNLDLLVKEREYQFQYELTTGARLRMLPNLILNGEISGRTKNTGAFSESLEPGVPPAPPSISSEQHVNRYDLTFTWNLLDFGLSYYKARQEVDKTIIRRTEFERTRQNLITDTIKEYWRARAALLGVRKSQELIAQANKFLAILDEQIAHHIIAKDQGLRYQNLILRSRLQMEAFEREYEEAMHQLAKNLGLPSVVFTLAEEEICCEEISLPPPEELEQLALLYRPELYGLDMQEKASADEARMAILQLFPALSPFISQNFDSNRFLIFNHWMVAGLRYSWNLLAIPYHMSEYSAAKSHKSAIRAARLAMSVGILTQLNLAWMLYHENLEIYQLAAHFAAARQELLDAMTLRQQVGEISCLELFSSYAIDAVAGEVEAMRAYGELQLAIEQINNSIGIPFYCNDCSLITE